MVEVLELLLQLGHPVDLLFNGGDAILGFPFDSDQQCGNQTRGCDLDARPAGQQRLPPRRSCVSRECWARKMQTGRQRVAR